MRLVDADTVVTIQVYDDMTENTDTKKMTIADAIDEWSDEGCPPTVKPIVGEDGMAFSEISKVLIAEATDLRAQRKNEGAEALEEMAAFFSLIGAKVHGED